MHRLSFHKDLIIGNKTISDTSSTFIIAEAGVNHNGDIFLAKKLIDIAVDAGADAVKFQAFRTENLILKEVEKAPYQQQLTEKTESQYEMLKKLELRTEHYLELKKYCEKKGIIFLITPFDEISLQELEEIGIDAYKIASTDTTNLPFLKKVAKTQKLIILSTGMCYLEEVRAALEEIHSINKNVILLQCTANYPIRDEEANLNVIHTYRKNFDVILGYSDHSVGLGASLYSIPMGAKVVEKHFTINKEDDGPDHQASLNPDELTDYVKEIRKIETFIGSFEKKPTESEIKTRKSLQKYLVAAQSLIKGEEFDENSFVAKRTGGRGISPIKYKELIGKIIPRYYQKDEIIDEL